jgi:uncharacterized OB-fold protein
VYGLTRVGPVNWGWNFSNSKPLEIGMPVEMVARRLRSDGDRGMLGYGYKFRPVVGA